MRVYPAALLFAVLPLFASCTGSPSPARGELTHEDSVALMLSAILDTPVDYLRPHLAGVCLEPTTRSLREHFPDKAIPVFPTFGGPLLEELRVTLEDETGFPVRVGCSESGQPVAPPLSDSSALRPSQSDSSRPESPRAQIVLVEISVPVRAGLDTAWVAAGRRSLGADGFDPNAYFIVGKWVRSEEGWTRVDAAAIS